MAAKLKIPMRLMGNNVLVERIDRKVSAGGILIPETSNDRKAERARVIAVGPGEQRDTGLVVGDVIALEKWIGVGTKVVIDGRDMLIVDADEVIAVLDASADYEYGVDLEAATR
jgi:co-chaperonin GroES (HSP10)